MATIKIKFDNEQSFEYIKAVIEKEFGSTAVRKIDSHTRTVMFSFLYNTKLIPCWFSKYTFDFTGLDFDINSYSALFSTNHSEISIKAFKIIAQYFDCEFSGNIYNKKDILKIKKSNDFDFSVLAKEVQTFTEEEVRMLIQIIYSEFAELPNGHHTVYHLRRIIMQEVEGCPKKPIKIFKQ